MTLKQYRDILLTVSDKVYHFESSKDDEYIVWHEVGRKFLEGDNVIVETGARIALDFFTKNEYSDIPYRIEEAFCENDEIAITEPVIDYENDTGYIHYSYTCEVI